MVEISYLFGIHVVGKLTEEFTLKTSTIHAGKYTIVTWDPVGVFCEVSKTVGHYYQPKHNPNNALLVEHPWKLPAIYASSFILPKTWVPLTDPCWSQCCWLSQSRLDIPWSDSPFLPNRWISLVATTSNHLPTLEVYIVLGGGGRSGFGWFSIWFPNFGFSKTFGVQSWSLTPAKKNPATKNGRFQPQLT